MPKVHIDFETRSEVDIWETGAWAYAAHPSTQILCVAYAVDDGPVKLATSTRELENLAKDPKNIFAAHNAFFEQCIWHHVLHKRKGLPPIEVRRWRCSAAKAAVCSLPRSLEKAAKALGLPVEKDMEGRRIMLKLSKPRTPTKHNPSRWHNDITDFQKLYAYCKQDVVVERMIDDRLPDLTPAEQEVWFLDQEINMRGVQIDRELVEAALFVFGDYEKHLVEDIKRYTNGFLDGVSQIQKMREWLYAQGVDVPDLNKATVNMLLKREDLPAHVRKLLEARRQLGKTSIKKFVAMQNSIDAEDRLRDLFLYHGASTARWGGKLVQLQNLPRGSVKDLETCVGFIKQRDFAILDIMYSDVTEPISSCIRGAIIAKPGSALLCADYSAIETRVLFWLANELVGLAKLENGVDLYLDMACVIYDDKTFTKDANKDERQLGKKTILGCGYGMGSSKFAVTCEADGMAITAELAERSVKAYRNTYAAIPKLWKDQETAAIKAVRTGERVPCGKVIWEQRGAFLVCFLPSGRPMSYPNPKLEVVSTPYGEREQLTYMTVDSTINQFVRTKTYGGKIVENITQATARDVLAHAMLNCNKRGYTPVMHVHDELVVEVPEGSDKNLEEFVDLMLELPEWAAGCPISIDRTEAWRGTRYHK